MFHHDFGPEMLGLGVGETGRVRGRLPRRSSPSELETAHDATEQLGFRAGAGERDTDPRGGFGRGERLGLGDRVARREHEPVGDGVQHEAACCMEVACGAAG